MRLCVALGLVVVLCTLAVGGERRFVTGPRLTLGSDSSLSASVQIADVDGNGALDVAVANGRHWPGQNFLFLNQGRARFSVQRDLGRDKCPSYAAEPADIDGDGDLDIVVGNDMATNRVLVNDGTGRFDTEMRFGVNSSVRSLTVVDLDQDGDLDVLSTCRGRPNQIYLNGGEGRLVPGNTFGSKQDSTIDVAVVDWNGDGNLDLVLANRDDQQNSILINDGKMNFPTEVLFGTRNQQTRAVAVADMNGDGSPDIITANIGQPNRVYLSDGEAGFAHSSDFGSDDGRTYALAVADMDNDKDIDLIVGNVGQENAVFFNRGDGMGFSEVRFGDASHATYGVDAGDLDGDGFADIAVANSGAKNFVFLNQPRRPSPRSPSTATKKNLTTDSREPKGQLDSESSEKSTDWRSFRGNGGKGVADGFQTRTIWNADEADGEVAGVRWSTRVPGLGHSSPVINGDRIFLATAIASDGEAPLKLGRGGQPEAADDNGEQSWVVLCYDRNSGEELWRQTAHQGKPRATRHAKATHANTSVAVQGDNVVAFFGSEGIHCYDLDGNLKWSRDVGLVNISKYGIGWGFASSPAIHNDRIAIVCDDPDHPFVATLSLADGEEIWRAPRKEICERSWGTPLILSSPDRTQVVVNGWPWVVSYDCYTGEPLWKIRGGGDNPVPTPFESNGWIYVTSAHGAESPIFVVRPDATGDVTPSDETSSGDSILWSMRRGGSYMSTPVVYGDHLYLGNTNGVLRCFHAQSGEKIYEKRLGSGAAIIASLVAADGKIYAASENGIVYVVKSGPEFELLAENQMGGPCFATPAISSGVLYFRTTEDLIAIE